MKKYSVRPATPRDVEAVYELIAMQNKNDFGEALWTLDDLRRSWQKTALETNTCMAYGDGELAGFAELRDGDSPFIYLADASNVDLGFQLLTVLEDIAIDRKVMELSVQVSEKNQTLLELFNLNGYHYDLSFLIMEVVMDERPVAPQLPSSIHIRTFVLGRDEQETFRVDEEASQEKGYHEPLDFYGWLKRMGMELERFDPSLWFLACDGEQIVGVALNFFDRTTNTGWLDHLGVRRIWRKKGIGTALLLHSFGEFYRRGIKHVKLSVDSKSLTNAQHLYENVGMKTVQPYRIYKKSLQV